MTPFIFNHHQKKIMKLPIFAILLLFFLGYTHLAFAQTTPKDSLSFPESWEGIWTGTLDIFTQKGKTQSLPMELHILPIDTSDNHTFWIIYGEDKVAGLRPYELVTIDAEKGHYAIDEKNSIQMEAYLMENTLIQRFEVMNNMLITTNEKIGDTITWQIISGKMDAVSSTGQRKVDGEEIPEVKAFPIANMQKAFLTKKE